MRRRRQTINPLTGRFTELYANAAYCRLAGGATVAGHLEQVAARALPEHVTHIDHLCRQDPLHTTPFVCLTLRSLRSGTLRPCAPIACMRISLLPFA